MRLSAILASSFLICACQKTNSTVADPAKVTFSIISPYAGQTYNSNDTVQINGNVKYTGEMHGYEVMIIDTATGIIVYNEAQHVHTDHFVIDDKWTIDVSNPSTFKLVVATIINHNGDTASKEMFITFEP
jgi:hypothetical protein